MYMMIALEEDHHEYYRWIEQHGFTVERWLGKSFLRIPGACKHLEGGRCSIYAERPEMCREAYCEGAAKRMGCTVVYLEK